MDNVGSLPYLDENTRRDAHKKNFKEEIKSKRDGER